MGSDWVRRLVKNEDTRCHPRDRATLYPRLTFDHKHARPEHVGASMPDTTTTRGNLPWAVDWFINRTNAGDIDSVLETFGRGATIRHADEEIWAAIIGEFLSSPWFIAGYIHLRIRTWEQRHDQWSVVVDMTGRHKDLQAATGSFVFEFDLDSSAKINRLNISKKMASETEQAS
jgi:hypothetical protein